MNVSDLLVPLTRLKRRQRRLLVVETDGFVLRAAIVERKRKHVHIERVAQSKLTEPSEALADAISQLRSSKLPKQAVLLAPEVTSALLRLPVDPSLPRPAAQMQELVRWELEPHVAVNGGARPIGEVLVGLGHVTYENVTDVLSEMQKQKELAVTMPTGRRRVSRFGEVAQEMGLVTHRQVESGLAVQQRFQNSVDDLVCGWSGQPGDKPDDEGQYSWLSCGMSRQARETWAAAFEDQEIELLAMYPQIGTSVAALNGQGDSGRTTVVEIQPGAICTTRLVEGRVQSHGVHLTAGHRPTSDLCRELASTGPNDTLWVTGRHPLLKTIADELTSKHQLKPRVIPVEVKGIAPPEISPASLTGIVGAARHALRLDGGHQAVAVQAQDAGPPAWREPRVWATAAAVLLPLLLGATELFLRWQRSSITHQRGTAVQELAKIEELAAIAQARLDEVQKLQGQLNDHQSLLEDKLRQRKFIAEHLPHRTQFLPQLLNALASAVSEEVVVQWVRETENHDIEIMAWALNERAAEEFIASIGRLAAPWDLTISTRNLGEEVGPLRLPGYKVQARLVPIKSTKTSSPASLQAQQTPSSGGPR